MKLFALLTFVVFAVSGCKPDYPQPMSPVTLAFSYSVPSQVLGQTRRINVYFPSSYRHGGTNRFPVLYLLDGGVKEDFFHIAGLASLAADFRNIREFVVVGIEGVDRYHDMTAPARVQSDRERLPTSGGSAKFREFLATELIPFVSQRFGVTDESVLIGESMAGLFVIETFLRRPELFGGYVAVSPSLWWDSLSLSREAATLLEKPFPQGRRLYLTSATDDGEEMQQGVDLLVAALKARAPADLQWSYHPMTAETHATTFHPAALAAVRKFFAISDSTASHQ